MKGSAGSSASPDTVGGSPAFARLIRYRASARQAGLSPLRPWPKMRCDRRRNAPGDRTETIKQLRIAIANFKSEVEEILREQKKD